MTAPLGDIAHLGHAELFSPDVEASVGFFTDFMGLTETACSGDSVYLRTYDDYETTSLIVTARDTPGLGRISLRAASPAALERRARAVLDAGGKGRWVEGDQVAGIGRTFRTEDPDGHPLDLYFDTTWYEAPADQRPALKNQAQAKPNRGVGVRRLDHVNFLAADVEANSDFHESVLGGRPTEQIRLDNGRIAARWLSFNNKSYDVVYTEDWTGSMGRLHHIAFATDERNDILRAADLAIDHGIQIETGPHKHAIQQTFFLYVFEPGGNRIELCNPLTRLVLAPDWRLVTWTEEERKKGQAWGLKTIESFHTVGTPYV